MLYVEHKLGRTIMPQFHAAFSGGAFLGALIGAGLAGIGVGLPAHLLVIAALVAALTLFAPRYSRRTPRRPCLRPVKRGNPRACSAWRDGRTLLIGVVVLGATLTEGAGNDWIAKAAVDGLDATESTGALLFAAFVLAMTAVRFFGGRAIDAYGRVVVLRASMAAAAAGLGLFVLAGKPLAGHRRRGALGERAPPSRFRWECPPRPTIRNTLPPVCPWCPRSGTWRSWPVRRCWATSET